VETRDQTLTKLTRLHGKSHPTRHGPASLRWDYSCTAVSIMKLVMEDGWWWGWRRIPLSEAPNVLQICPPEEEHGLAAAPYHKTRWILLSDFFLPEREYMELELRSVEVQGAHKDGGHAPGGWAPPTLVSRVWASFGWFFCQYFLLIPKISSVKFQVILRTFIFAQK